MLVLCACPSTRPCVILALFPTSCVTVAAGQQSRRTTVSDNRTKLAKSLPRRAEKSVEGVLAAMNGEIEELEYYRSSRSMSLVEEKATIKSILAVKQKMAQYVELNAMDEELNSLRESIDAARSRKAELQEGISTLQQVWVWFSSLVFCCAWLGWAGLAWVVVGLVWIGLGWIGMG